MPPFGFYAPFAATPGIYDGAGNFTADTWNNSNAFWMNGYTVPINPTPDCLGAIATASLVDDSWTGGGWLNAQKSALDIGNTLSIFDIT